MTIERDPAATGRDAHDGHLQSLGYEEQFHRSMGLVANFALGFTYLSPLVGVYSLFALGLGTAGPPSVWWIVIVGCGQLLVALVFGEVVSQYPISGGIYPWTRRLWGARYAWVAAWVYVWAMIVTITAVAEFGGGFVASLFGLESTPAVGLATAVGLLLVALAFNFSGTHMLSRVARIGLFAELIGVIAVGLYLMLFQRKQPFSVFFDSMGTAGSGSYFGAFVAAALTGLFLFYGFEACGDVAEEVDRPGRRIPLAMVLSIVVGGVSALMSFVGYVLAAPNLAAIVAGTDEDPIPGILRDALGTVGQKIFLVVAITAFLSCVLSLQAAASRLMYSFARDQMVPGHQVLGRLSAAHAVPTNALLVACLVPLAICVYIYLEPGALVPVTAFAVLGIYICFQMVVLAALRQRLRGWRPAGEFSLGGAGTVVNALALAYGLVAIVLLARPGSEGSFVDRWTSLLGLGVVLVVGLAYLLIARPTRHSRAPQGDAREVAEVLRSRRAAPARDSRGATPGA